jgi:uncharacterized membrane protein YgcG
MQHLPAATELDGRGPWVIPVGSALRTNSPACHETVRSADPTQSPRRGQRIREHWLGGLLACAFLLIGATLARAQVHDNAGKFSKEAIEQADQTIEQIKVKHRHTLLVETFPNIPESLQNDFRDKGKNRFFEDWAEERRKAEDVDGVVVLICMDPGHVQINIGNETQKKLFTQADRTELLQHVTAALKDKQYDDALTKTANFVLKKFDEHDRAETGNTNSAVVPPPAYTPPASTPPTYTPPTYSQPNYTHVSSETSHAFGGIGVFLCLIVGVIIVIALLRMVFRNTGGGYGGGGGGGGGGGYGGGGPSYPPPGYGGGNVGGYGPGYAPPSRGSGFGSGFLGGLLGGAVGGYAEDKLMHPNQGGTPSGGGYSQPAGGGYSAPPPDAGGSFTPDTSSSGGGADFGSSSDSSSASGSDFGSSSDSSSSSGSDFGSSSDSGGGGSDFGGGGGDGGSSGGDGGSSGGSDF